MNASDDYCELCDLPRSQCVHGQPPPAPKKKAAVPTRRPARAAPQARPSTPPPTPVTRRWTPPDVFKPFIITVLERAGGELEADELFSELEVLVEDRLRDADSETTPEGELRWRYAARRARLALINEGLMTKTRPGVWQLAGGR
jgi:hypothetical protein